MCLNKISKYLMAGNSKYSLMKPSKSLFPSFANGVKTEMHWRALVNGSPSECNQSSLGGKTLSSRQVFPQRFELFQRNVRRSSELIITWRNNDLFRRLCVLSFLLFKIWDTLYNISIIDNSKDGDEWKTKSIIADRQCHYCPRMNKIGSRMVNRK